MCTICFEPITTEQPTKDIKCGHKFHEECFDRWSNNETPYVACPLCRAQYKKKYLYYNPPHFVILHPKPKAELGPSMLTVLIGVAIGCIIVSIFDTAKINKNWELTKIWTVILIILVLLKRNTSS